MASSMSADTDISGYHSAKGGQQQHDEVEQEDGDAKAVLDNVERYRRFCAECHCRCNSAVLKYIASHGQHTPLCSLNLSNNYIGAKSFEPIAMLLEESQTVEQVDLSGNGLNNANIARLCAVLSVHLGVSRVNVSGNHITMDGGKHLMRLVEKNHRIVYVGVDNTDIYASLSQRLAMAADTNAGIQRTVAPGIQQPQEGKASPAAAAAPERVFGRPPVQRTRPTTAQVALITKAPERPKTSSGVPSIATATGTSSSATTAPGFNANASPMKPRPPPPAIASREVSRMSDAQRDEIRQRMVRRAEHFSDLDSTPASRATDSARRELMLLEAAEKRYEHRVSSATANRMTSINKATEQPTGSIAEQVLTRTIAEASGAVQPTTSGKTTTAKGQYSGGGALGPRPPPRRQSVDDEAEQPRTVLAVEPQGEEAPLPSSSSSSTSGFSAFSHPSVAAGDAHAKESPHEQHPQSEGEEETAGLDQMKENLNLVVTTKEMQFRRLFQMGVDHYHEKNLDAAYVCWNEAMELAAAQKNREWIAVITNNLQRLSYELLVAEGTKHMEALELIEADKSFAQALELALKAKNATWEGEMNRARKNVQHSTFQSAHEAATRAFDKLVSYVDVPVTSDDLFQDKAADKEPTPHSMAFVNEWGRMLLLKEALEQWADAIDVARRIGGTSSKMLQEVVRSSVLAAASFTAKRLLLSEDAAPPSLSLMQTHAYSYNECSRLLQLWTEMHQRACVVRVPAWDAIAAAQMGNLYVATHQLTAALTKFETVIECGKTCDDSLLVAIGHTYRGLLYWQRSSYTSAERDFASAIALWSLLRAKTKKRAESSGVAGSDGAEGSTAAMASIGSKSSDALIAMRGSANDGGADASAGSPQSPAATAAALMAEATATVFCSFMLRRSYWMAVLCLIGTHRYSEALEMQERSLLNRMHDRLSDKISTNFTSKPNIDQIAAVAASLDSPLVYVEIARRFDWNQEKEKYDVSESVLLWVVPKEGNLKFVIVDATRDFKVPSLTGLISDAREALLVEPLTNRPSGDVQLMMPDLEWKEPLSQLYRILFDPIVDFVQAHVAYSDCGVVTLIPSGVLWGVPFPALLNKDTSSFVGERFALQHAFSALHQTYCSLSALRAKQKHNTATIVVAQQDQEPSSGVVSKFPLDSLRSVNEAEKMLKVLQHATYHSPSSRRSRQLKMGSPTASHGNLEEAGETTGAKGGGEGSHTSSPLSPPRLSGGSEELEQPMEPEQPIVVLESTVLKQLMNTARAVHFATATIEPSSDEADGETAGVCISTSYDTLGVLRASELAMGDMSPEFVAFSTSNVTLVNLERCNDAMIGVARATLSAGCPCVIASQWCTPDMLPADFFTLLYSIMKREPHKAKALAMTMRKLADDHTLRFRPRLWAGYCAIGVGTL